MSYGISTDFIGPKHSSTVTIAGINVTHATTSFSMAIETGTQDPANLDFNLTVYSNGTIPQLVVLVCEGLSVFTSTGYPLHIPNTEYPAYLPLPRSTIVTPVCIINHASYGDGVVHFARSAMDIYAHNGNGFQIYEGCKIYGFTLRYPYIPR